MLRAGGCGNSAGLSVGDKGHHVWAFLFFILSIYLLAGLHSMCHLSSLTRDLISSP